MLPLALVKHTLRFRPMYQRRRRRAASSNEFILHAEQLDGYEDVDNLNEVEEAADIYTALYPDPEQATPQAEPTRESPYLVGDKIILPYESFCRFIIQGTFRCTRHIKSLTHCDVYEAEHLTDPGMAWQARAFELRNLDKKTYSARNGDLKKWKKRNMQGQIPPLSFKAHGKIWVITKEKDRRANVPRPSEVRTKIVDPDTLDQEFPALSTASLAPERSLEPWPLSKTTIKLLYRETRWHAFVKE
ncbi:hypothetical protein SLS54_008406 [Diplodia seriata]